MMILVAVLLQVTTAAAAATTSGKQASQHLGTMQEMEDGYEYYEYEEYNVFGLALERCSKDGMAMTGLDDRCGHNPQFDDRSHPICIDIPSFPTILREKGKDEDEDDDDEEEQNDRNHKKNNYHTGHVIPTTTKEKEEEADQEASEGQHFRRRRQQRQRRTSLWSSLFGGGGAHKDNDNNKSSKSRKGINFFTATGEQNWVDDQIPCADDPRHKTCPIQHWCVNEKSFADFLHQVGGCDKIGNIICEAINRNVLDMYKKSGDKKDTAALRCIMDRCWIPAK